MSAGPGVPVAAGAEEIEAQQAGRGDGGGDQRGVDIARQRYSEGKRAERKLGMLLCAPAVILMLAVTAYPILYAV